MGCHYYVSGTIPLKADVPEAAIDQLREDLECENTEVEARGGLLHVAVGGQMGHSHACEIDDLLQNFAEGHAKAAAVFETEYEYGEHGELIVGPNERAKLEAELAYVRKKLEVLELRQAGVLAELAKLEGE